MKDKHTVFMVGTTHFDPVWMWTWDEGMASIRSTFRSALDRMNEDPNFIYSFSCPPVFEWIRKVDAKLFEEIRRRVADGRWDLVEGWWLQPDCNVAAGESYARQGLYGQRYLLETFGKLATTGFNTDSFGHSAMLPQIYSKSGMTAYVFGRPSQAHKALPGPLFVWQSPDGSGILAFRCGSDGANAYPQDVRKSIDELADKLATIGHDMMMLYGVSNHGGAPTKQAIADINDVIRHGKKDFDIAFSSVDEFFRRQDRATLPVVADELQVHDFGVFSNHTEVKKNNRMAEHGLLNAERFALMAGMLTGLEYPAEALKSGWKDVLFNQFHDIIGGASVKPAYFDARNLHGRALQTTKEIIHTSLQAMTKDIDTSAEGFPLVVWNPNPFDVQTGIEAELQWAWEFPWYGGDLTLTDPDGKVVPCQVIQELSGLPRFRSRFVFRDTLPACGYKAYSVQQKSQPAALSLPMIATETTIENDRYQVAIDQDAGCIASIRDKNLGRDVMKEAAMPRVQDDKGDTWAFNIDAYGPDLGAFKMESVEVIESGPVRILVRTKSRYNDSTMEQDIILYRHSDTIEGRFRVNWREKRRALKLCFTPTMENPTVTSAIPYGSIERANDGQEMPAGEWLDLSEGDHGVSILTDSVFSYDVKGATAGLTLLRSPFYAHHGHPMQRNHIDESKDYDHLGQGVHEGSWKLVPHDGSWKEAEIPRHAVAFNNPVITIDEANHPGTRPRTNSFLTTKSQSVLVTAIKQSEDDENLVLRMVEYAGRGDEVHIAIKPIGREIRIHVAPYEIKTVMLVKDEDYKLVETDLLERV